MMKKMWKMRKDKSAVSPVIATILMVAITVVLAAVLYVMVMGFGGSTNSTPTGSFTSVSGTSTAKQVNIGVITPATKWSDCKVSILPNVGGGVVTVSGAMSASGTAVSMTFPGSPAPYTATGTNLASNGNINSGDYLTITSGLTAGASYTITLIHVPTGGSIATLTFTA